ncbi:GguC protein, partial [Xylophilus sp. Kf1]|nr:GguC protein [Xylophilus sp. Kf1]
APDGRPFRLGFALANEFSDHVTERGNYLWLAHSKLRVASFGPELRVGELPADVRGTSRLVRDGAVIWEKPFLSGEANMSHSLANLEHHHFKYDLFRRPGDVHVHFFGTATLSFA